MVFSTTTLFKSIACPEKETCKLTNCIFGHELRPQAAEAPGTAAANPSKQITTASSEEDHMKMQSPSNQDIEPAAKRRKFTYETLADKPLSIAEKIKADLEATRSGDAVTRDAPPSSATKHATAGTNGQAHPASLSKPVSPPAVGGRKRPPPEQDSQEKASDEPKKPVPVKKESLNPRLLTNSPDTHAKRTLYLQHLHKDMARLNNELKSVDRPIQSIPPDRLKVIALSDQEVITLALDEEEKAARDQPKVYANVIKNRIAAYRKMDLEAFIDVVKTSFNKGAAKPPPKKEGRSINTDLTPSEEAQVVRHLVVADQNMLSNHGYIPNPPTAAEAEEAAKAVATSQNYEECDRCSARFRVFPDRNEEGKLTTNGPCRHHPNKKIYPKRQKTDHYTGGKDPFYPCCMEPVGSQGCTTSEDHVFKASSPARLAAVMPFITTPENSNPAKDRDGQTIGAVSFDCEMGYTALGLELIRLTAVSWPENKPLLDTLVRPLGTIIDLNSRFSGVWPEHFANAIPHADWKPPTSPIESQDAANSSPPPLAIVDSPQDARSLLCAYLTPWTPLIGHAIENDLNATRLCHPSIVDTALLYPHPRGLPMRFGLKMLAKKYLERDVQMGGDRGHDSLEDAVATGDLVRLKVGIKWREMKGKGWGFGEDGILSEPAVEDG